VQAPPPKTVFRNDGRTGIAVDSMLSPGCIVSGGRVVHSILSPHVRVHSWAHIEDSILFEGVDVARHARIRRAIITEGVKVPENAEIGYDSDKDRERFIITESGVAIVQKGAKI
jgi:glucose-1-phosphate adenylyltransferase